MLIAKNIMRAVEGCYDLQDIRNTNRLSGFRERVSANCIRNLFCNVYI